MTDEAHRSQYADFATNTRRALPNASFIAFTGTPLMGVEDRTKAVFGDYASLYQFQKSIDEGVTVPRRSPPLPFASCQKSPLTKQH